MTQKRRTIFLVRASFLKKGITTNVLRTTCGHSTGEQSQCQPHNAAAHGGQDLASPLHCLNSVCIELRAIRDASRATPLCDASRATPLCVHRRTHLRRNREAATEATDCKVSLFIILYPRIFNGTRCSLGYTPHRRRPRAFPLDVIVRIE